MYGNALEEMKRDPSIKIVSYIQEQVIGELSKEYSECVKDTDVSLPSVLANINAKTKEQFIIIMMSGTACSERIKTTRSSKRNILICLEGYLKGLHQEHF